MVIAKLSDGTLVLGLSRENIDRLTTGEPISVTKKSHGVEMPTDTPRIAVVFGETESAIAADLKRVFGNGSH